MHFYHLFISIFRQEYFGGVVEMAASVALVAVPIILSAILTYFLAKFLRIAFLINKFPGPPEYPVINKLMTKPSARGE